MKIDIGHSPIRTTRQDAHGVPTRSGNMSKPSTYRGDASNTGLLATLPEHVPAVDISPAGRHARPVRRGLSQGRFAESAKLEQTIKANLRGLGYGG